MVVGHYGCGGVQAVVERRSAGLADNWLRHIEDVMNKYDSFLNQFVDDNERGRRLCELSVVEQMANVCRTTIVRRAWYRGQRIEVHGLVYGLHDGILRPIGLGLNSAKNWADGYEKALSRLLSKQTVPPPSHE